MQGFLALHCILKTPFIFRECSSILVRLTNMTRGVGNPLVAVYAKAFLCLVRIDSID